LEKIDKCPRCNLPQKGIYKCQYCGYNLKKYNKKNTTIIRRRLKGIISDFKEGKTFSSNKKSKVGSINNAGRTLTRKDEWGFRSGTDRRKRRYKTYYPERRSGMDRRKSHAP
jgi:hypothetical protein